MKSGGEAAALYWGSGSERLAMTGYLQMEHQPPRTTQHQVPQDTESWMFLDCKIHLTGSTSSPLAAASSREDLQARTIRSPSSHELTRLRRPFGSQRGITGEGAPLLRDWLFMSQGGRTLRICSCDSTLCLYYVLPRLAASDALKWNYRIFHWITFLLLLMKHFL